MNADELTDLLATAFHGVTLEGGISIRQGEVCDNYGKDNTGRELSDAAFAAIPRGEITDDWRALPFDELERFPYLAHMDAKGFRYYIPAFLLSLLHNANGISMRVVGTLSSLYPKRDSWLHHMQLYDLLTKEQRSAIATFLFELQSSPRLDRSDQRLVSAALQAYWLQYLPQQHESNNA
jgi:hypothetical protein